MNPLVTEARALCSSRYPYGIWYRSSEERAKTLLPEMAAEIERLEMQIEFLLKVIADKEAEINHPRTYSSGGYVYHETAINWPGFDSRTDKPSPR